MEQEKITAVIEGITVSNLENELKARFGVESVSRVERQEGLWPLLLIDFPDQNHVKVLMTDGLSNYRMTVPEKESGKEYNEIYFCLPSYWDLNDTENAQMNWVFQWIDRLRTYVEDKQSWFGHGHTMPCGKEMVSLSKTMLQNHFFLLNPSLLEKELQPLKVDGKTVRFLSIVPIFEDEMDYKQGKGTFKLAEKLRGKGITEKLDDYRTSVLRSKWSFRSK